jgi:hypothetical protein
MSVPDAPVSKFVLTMQGGHKGLLQNSTNVCDGQHRVIASFDAHSGAVSDSRPALVDGKCHKRVHHKKKGHNRHKSAKANGAHGNGAKGKGHKGSKR